MTSLVSGVQSSKWQICGTLLSCCHSRNYKYSAVVIFAFVIITKIATYNSITQIIQQDLLSRYLLQLYSLALSSVIKCSSNNNKENVCLIFYSVAIAIASLFILDAAASMAGCKRIGIYIQKRVLPGSPFTQPFIYIPKMWSTKYRNNTFKNYNPHTIKVFLHFPLGRQYFKTLGSLPNLVGNWNKKNFQCCKSPSILYIKTL